MKDNNNVKIYNEVVKELSKTYVKKNKDYGNSFELSLNEDGLLVSKIRLGDKYNRFSNLIKTPAEVADESIRDTLMDMANYAIMTVMWMDKNSQSKCDGVDAKSEEFLKQLNENLKKVKDEHDNNIMGSPPEYNNFWENMFNMLSKKMHDFSKEEADVVTPKLLKEMHLKSGVDTDGDRSDVVFNINDVREHLNKGYSIAEIAKKLNIQESTIRSIKDGE